MYPSHLHLTHVQKDKKTFKILIIILFIHLFSCIFFFILYYYRLLLFSPLFFISFHFISYFVLVQANISPEFCLKYDVSSIQFLCLWRTSNRNEKSVLLVHCMFVLRVKKRVKKVVVLKSNDQLYAMLYIFKFIKNANLKMFIKKILFTEKKSYLK